MGRDGGENGNNEKSAGVMYSDKANVNILTALMLEHGVRTVVVCPGSRNAPIVHNLQEAGLECHGVTDERSAGFYALGMTLAKREPVAVCVTSGSALLNLAPAVAEAYYRNCPLVIISADRSLERIGQLDAQTLPQQNALGCFVGMSVSLPEVTSEMERTYCNRLVNEALLTVGREPCVPVHINVPIAEPLFGFTVPRLPEERVIRRIASAEEGCDAVCVEILSRILRAERPMVVVGQMPRSAVVDEFVAIMGQYVTVLYEPLSSGYGCVAFDDVLSSVGADIAYMPDFCLYVGGIVVSKRMKKFLQDAPGSETWIAANDGKMHDTFMNLSAVVDVLPERLLAGLTDCIKEEGSELLKRMTERAVEYGRKWREALVCNGEETLKADVVSKGREEDAIQGTRGDKCGGCGETIPDTMCARGESKEGEVFSEEEAVRLFEEMMQGVGKGHVHYANSTAVRLGCRYAKHYIYVNRGVNGIEGSLSTAAGFSLCMEEKTYCVIGDLSFFYDSNALWNNEIDGRLRIVLLNNGGGGIFHTLAGLEQSAARERYVMARHETSAEGICETHDVVYIKASDAESLMRGMERLVCEESRRPMLLEVDLRDRQIG